MKWAILIFGVLVAGGFFTVKLSTKNGNDEYDEIFLREATANGIDPKLLKAIAMNESGLKFNYTQLERIGGTTGILHIKLSTAQDYEPELTATELSKPETQIRVAAKHIKRLLSVFNGDSGKVVAAYNAGEGRIQQGIIPQTTKEYLERFQRNYKRVG